MNRVIVITLTAFGIFILAAVPLLGAALLLIAFVGGCSGHDRERRHARHRRELAELQADRDFILAWKSVPE